MIDDPQTLVRAAREADREARHHKRAERMHRMAAKAARERQAELDRRCAEAGITIAYR